MIPRPKTALLLAVLVALSGCTVIGANGTPTTQPGTFVDTIQGQSPTPSASPSPSPSPSPPTTQSPSPSPTRSPTPTPTPPPTADDMVTPTPTPTPYPYDEPLHPMYREFIDALEDRGIDVWTTDSSAGSHSFWMAYRTHAGDWGGVASEVETVIDAWCDTEPGADQVFIEIAEPDETPRQTIAAIHFWESDGVCDMSDRERMTFILGQFDTDH